MRPRLLFLFIMISAGGMAQDSLHQAPIVVLGRSYRDSISLRWAPTRFSIWQEGNTSGYVIERYTMVRNKIALNRPEKKVLNAIPLKPVPEDRWEPLVRGNKYAAIAAQALYGNSFEIEMQQSDIFQVVNKVKENDQRFSFALFSADLSAAVARASALLFTDRQVVAGEQYLYRILIVQSGDTLRGSAFIEPGYIVPLPKPDHLKILFREAQATLQWDHISLNNIYTAYQVERSEDGKEFKIISEAPATTFSPSLQKDSPFEYYSDSLPDISRTYYYRVRGLTPFGDHGPPSDVANGKSFVETDDVPMIIQGQNLNNKTILINWEFPEEGNNRIQGFHIERSENPRGPFTLLEQVNSSARSYEDMRPAQVNYYKVQTQSLQGHFLASPMYLVQLIDSIPPDEPKNVKTAIDEFGYVTLHWNANTEEDIYGYRIYRANQRSEELFQVTHEPIAVPHYVDTVNLNTLNKYVYYSVMSIDRSQNHSVLSSLLEVKLPDKVKPQAPVFLPVKNSEHGVLLQWEQSASTDVASYDVYRQQGTGTDWRQIKTLKAQKDSTYQYMDTTSAMGSQPARYTVVAVDESGLESDPASAISGSKIQAAVKPKVQWNKPVADRRTSQIILNWKYTYSGVESFRIYRAKGSSPSILYKSLLPTSKQFIDKELTIGEEYTYRIMAVFTSGSKSELSDSFSISY